MKAFKSFRAICALLLTGSLLCTPAASAEEANLAELLTKHAAILEELGKAVAALNDGKESAVRANTPPAVLQLGSLTTGQLQSGGLDSASPGLRSLAPGLMPVEQWRALFPEKKQ